MVTSNDRFISATLTLRLVCHSLLIFIFDEIFNSDLFCTIPSILVDSAVCKTYGIRPKFSPSKLLVPESRTSKFRVPWA